MNLKITLDNQVVSATLEDNPTSQDFIKKLPLEVELEDYVGKEKIFSVGKLSTKNAPSRYQGKKGDITYYAPWGNMALFYGTDNPNASGLIYLGKINGDISLLKKAKTIKIEKN
ncbi:cyclophilin-like fold protein [Neisseria animalis]|uniref:Cyclophilin-like domain-containing protein n=1 Tax=Neisseria animalis TaxID=492 RepID=A0A5P3MTQ4_NEIAN|nr:cyclophilin-like fold protein [Neisseria animalis]QEY24987.1 hypothetical protein D0T90_05445 [Neisseria animalis]ROW32697.1 hypothetical protein CGZ60_03785 [Neisseria animalis]VEE06060.1 Uncharacterized conserved protein [Neisseria animalis]